MGVARNLAVQNKKQPLEACIVPIAVGCEDAELGLELPSNRQNEKLMIAQGGQNSLKLQESFLSP